MKINFNKSILVALCVAALAPAGQAQQLIINGGFESGFTGWTRQDQTGSDGSFLIQTGTTSPTNGFTVAAPPAGTQAAMTDAQGPGTHILYQDFLVPNNAGGAAGGQVSFSLYLNSQSSFFTPATLDFSTTALNQQARIDIISPTADPFSVSLSDVLQNLYQVKATDLTVSGYTSMSVDISALLLSRRGQTLRLRIAEVDNVAPLNFGVDQVAVLATAPEPGSLPLALLAGTTLLAVARRRKR